MESREQKMNLFIRKAIEMSILDTSISKNFDESILNAAYTMIEEHINETTKSDSDIGHKIKTLKHIHNIIDGCVPFMENYVVIKSHHEEYDDDPPCIPSPTVYKGYSNDINSAFEKYTKNVLTGLRNFSKSINKK